MHRSGSEVPVNNQQLTGRFGDQEEEEEVTFSPAGVDESGGFYTFSHLPAGAGSDGVCVLRARVGARRDTAD